MSRGPVRRPLMTTEAAELRLLQPGDASVWREIRLQALATDPQAFSSRLADWQDRPLGDFARRLAKVRTFAILEAGRAVATAGWAPDLDPALRHRGWVVAVYVMPGHRGRGHAERLMRHLVRDAAAAGLESLWLEVRASGHKAQDLYRRAGFAPVPADEAPRRACGNDEVVMCRVLARPASASGSRGA